MAKKAKTAPDEAQTANGDTAPQDTTGGTATDRSETSSGYFRRLFKRKPRLLEQRSNDEALRRWLKDHPGYTEAPATVKNTLANIKSILRKKLAERDARRGESEPAEERPAPTRARPSELQQLEEHIDSCMMLAKEIDAEGLANVIRTLRDARNEVVWKAGDLRS